MSNSISVLRNGFVLGSSLFITSMIGLFVKILFPRILGPENYGMLRFIESTVETAFILTSLGIDTYIRRSIHEGHDPKTYLGSVMIIRTILSAILTFTISISFFVSHKPIELQWLLVIYAASQIFFVGSQTFTAVVHTSSDVKKLAVINVSTKIFWAAAATLCLFWTKSLFMISMCVIASEALKFFWLIRYLRQETNLTFTCSFKNTVQVLKEAAPLYINQIALLINARIGITILGFVSSNKEVGWYGAATTLSMIMLMFIPIVNWVLLPAGARHMQNNPEKTNRLMRQAFFWTITLVTPVSLMVGLGAHTWISILFGSSFAPAAFALQVLAPLFVITYASTILATYLIQINLNWLLTKLSVLNLLIAISLHLILVPYCAERFGEGGAGTGAALSALLTECFSVLAMIYFAGKKLFGCIPYKAFGQIFANNAIVISLYFSVPIPQHYAIMMLAPTFMSLSFASRLLHFPSFVHILKRLLMRNYKEAV